MAHLIINPCTSLHNAHIYWKYLDLIEQIKPWTLCWRWDLTGNKEFSLKPSRGCGSFVLVLCLISFGPKLMMRRALKETKLRRGDIILFIEHVKFLTHALGMDWQIIFTCLFNRLMVLFAINAIHLSRLKLNADLFGVLQFPCPATRWRYELVNSLPALFLETSCSLSSTDLEWSWAEKCVLHAMVVPTSCWWCMMGIRLLTVLAWDHEGTTKICWGKYFCGKGDI